MVGSYTQLLSQRYKGQIDAEADEYLGFAHDGVVRMRELIDDLLAFARVGTRVNPLGPVATNDVVDQARHNLEATITSQGAVVERGELPEVVGDSTQLLQLFQNLVANALKFHGGRPSRVRVEAQRSGAEWTFTVADNGIGIPPEYHGRIFGMFQRLHGRGEYPGTGIGLAICKRVVERHGGRIWVESSGVEGEGSKFRFTLPAEGPKSVRPVSPAVAGASTPAARQAQTLIEDRLRQLI
jgi:light-regulated signal transduction histidine kinase (bacteriophytochrome)